MSQNTQFVETPAVSLYTSMGVTDITCTITPAPVDLDGNALAMTDFGSIGYFTIDPKISGFEEIVSFTGLTNNGNNTATLTGLTRNLMGKYPYTASTAGGKLHGSSAVVVFSDNPQVYASLAAKANNEIITGTWTFNNFPVTPPTLNYASATVVGITKLSVAPVSSTNPIAVGINDTVTFAPITAAFPTGGYLPFAGRTAPSGFLTCQGSAVSAATYPSLFTVLYPTFTVTITIASPGVFTTGSAHGFVVGDQVSFSTTGGLPAGLTAGINYFVISTGLTSTQFEVALTPGGPAIVTTGSQSGVQTVYWSNYGPYNGTSFYVPDTRGVGNIVGVGGSSTTVLGVDPTNISGNVLTVPDSDYPVQGQTIVYTAAGTPITGLTSGSTYYVIRLSATTISLASSQANANAGTVISLSGSPTGSQVFTFTTVGRTIIGKRFGEEFHGSSTTETSSHSHVIGFTTSSAGAQNAGVGGTTSATPYSSQATGGNITHNNMPPSLTALWIIKT